VQTIFLDDIGEQLALYPRKYTSCRVECCYPLPYKTLTLYMYRFWVYVEQVTADIMAK